MTSDQEEAKHFIKSNPAGTVYKTFTGTDFGFYETRLISTEIDLAELWRVATCPTIFQAHIDGEYDIRATVVGGEVFAAKIEYKKGRHPIDGRCDRVPTLPLQLPAELTQKLVQLTASFGLHYAAIDLRYSADHGYVFFELNPEGQFLWVEIEAGLPISRALAKFLLEGPCGDPQITNRDCSARLVSSSMNLATDSSTT
jgi:glutathione synthase/RimK-type ligase-like ATP-grasp enzyme